MAFTAFKQMQARNQKIFEAQSLSHQPEQHAQSFPHQTGRHAEAFPHQPERHYDTIDHSLKAMALRFLHTRCEDLLFDDAIASQEQAEGKYYGTSLRPGQIPYNMQMDVNRLCMERELEKFIESGVAEDAYTIYYCFLEMFFGHYGKSKKMVELLSEFESNGSSLLMKHRDHYSHSVYVFALGLSIYESNTTFRATFKKFYGFDTDESNKKEDLAAAHCFLEFWGLTSLFHDIGYPFELPFEQVLSYFEVDGKERGKDSIFLAYHNVKSFTKISGEAKEHFNKMFGRKFKSLEELLAFWTTKRLGAEYDFSEEYILKKIHDKPISPEAFGYFMDHAYFSAGRLFRELEQAIGIDKINDKHIDSLTAILMHNSLFKFAISFYKDDDAKGPLKMDKHPLAYLLMLCDELQCWDRTSYGRNSRSELHPMSTDFDFKNNSIHAVYYYDKDEQEKIDSFKETYRKWEDDGEAGPAPRLKAYSDMAEKEQRFTADIEKIVDLTDIPLTVVPNTKAVDRKSKHTYLSTSNFLHLYDFAVALNARHSYQGEEEKVDIDVLEKEFENLSLEYQLSNINQAKQFSKYLNAIGCFYTDRPVDYEMIPAFNKKHTSVFAPMEHERWILEHISMAWANGNKYETIPIPAEMIAQYGDEVLARKALREQLRMHKLTMDGHPKKSDIFAHYEALPEKEKGKDYKPFNSMLKLIKKYDGLRIYTLE